MTSEKEKYAQRLLDSKCGICGLDVSSWVTEIAWTNPARFCCCEKPVRRSEVLRSLFGPPVTYEECFGRYVR